MKKVFLKFASVTLTLALLFTSLTVAASAETDTSAYKLENIAIENPIYENTYSYPLSSLSVKAKRYLNSSFNLNEYTNNQNKVIADIRRGMVNRENSISIKYVCNQDGKEANQLFSELFYKWTELAVAETGNGKEGDYLRGVYNNIEIKKGDGSYIIEDDKYYFDITLTINYYTTKAQEDEVDLKIAEIISGFGFNSNTSQKEKIDTIYKYVIDNIEYDDENFSNDDYKLKHTVYAALINGKAVCQGYALLFYRLARECGLEVRAVSGYANGPHAWNIVKIENWYYNLDATWDDKWNPYKYYLKGQYFPEHTLDSEYNTAQFKSAYPISMIDYTERLGHTDHSYDNNCDKYCNECGDTRSVEQHRYRTTKTIATIYKDGNSVTKCEECGYIYRNISIKRVTSFNISTEEYTYNGKTKTPFVTVKDSNGKVLNKGIDYTVSYAVGRKKVGKYAVTVTLRGNYSGSKTLYFKIVPKKTEITNVTAKSKTSVKISFKKQSSQVTGYQISYSTSSKFASAKTKTVKSYKTTSYTLKGLKKNKKYYLRIRTYKTVNGKEYYSDWTTYEPEDTKITKITAKKKSLKVSFKKKSSKISGYQIRYSTSKKFKSAKTKTVSGYKNSSYTVKSLKAKKTYYVQIRTYKTVNGKKYYSDWSDYKYKKTK